MSLKGQMIRDWAYEHHGGNYYLRGADGNLYIPSKAAGFSEGSELDVYGDIFNPTIPAPAAVPASQAPSTPSQVFEALLNNGGGGDFGTARSFDPALNQQALQAIAASSSPELQQYWADAVNGGLSERPGYSEGSVLSGMNANQQSGRWLLGYLDDLQKTGNAEDWIGAVNSDPNAKRVGDSTSFMDRWVEPFVLPALTSIATMGAGSALGLGASTASGVGTQAAADMAFGNGAGGAVAGSTGAASGGLMGTLEGLMNNFNPLNSAASTGVQGAIGDTGIGEVANAGATPFVGDIPIDPSAGTTALPDAGVDMGIFNPGQANPYVTGAAGGDALGAINSAAAGGAVAGGATAAGTAAGAAAGVAGGSAISRILDGTATAADYTQVLGGVGAAGLGAFGASQQADAFRDLATQARNDRAPFLAKANEWLANPSAYIAGPGQSAMQGVLRSLSVNGNPANNPSSLATATEAGLRDWRGAVTGFGNMGLAGEDTRASLGTNAINSDAGVWNAVGGGIADVTRPRNSLTDLYRQLRNGGLV